MHRFLLRYVVMRPSLISCDDISCDDVRCGAFLSRVLFWALFGICVSLVATTTFALETDVFFPSAGQGMVDGQVNTTDAQTLLWVDNGLDMRCRADAASCTTYAGPNARVAIVKDSVREWILTLPDTAALGLGHFSGAGAQVLSPVKNLGAARSWSGRAEALLSAPEQDVLIQSAAQVDSGKILATKNVSNNTKASSTGVLTLTPRLESTAASEIRLVFPRLNLPPAAEIQKAVLVLTPREPVSDPHPLKIAFAHSAKALHANAKVIGFRGFGESTVVTLPASNGAHVPQEVDITSALRTHVMQGRQAWCFGEAVGLTLSQASESNQTISITSFDENPELAPRLIVRYRASAAGRRCAVAESAVFSDLNNAEDLQREGANLSVADRVPLAMGFRHVRFQPGLKTRLEEAKLRVVAASPLRAGTQFILGAHYVSQSQSLPGYLREGVTNLSRKNLSRRAGPTVRWVLSESVAAGAEITTPDLSVLLSPILTQSGWASGDSIVITLQTKNTQEFIQSIQQYPGAKPTLFLRWRGLYEKKFLQAHRYRLLEAVARLGFSGARSAHLTLGEAARYWAGQPAQLGIRRGATNPFQAHLLPLSSADVFMRKPLSRLPSGCEGLDLRDAACAAHRWVGRPQYAAPALEQCTQQQTAVIVSGMLKGISQGLSQAAVDGHPENTVIALTDGALSGAKNYAQRSPVRYAQHRQSLLQELQKLRKHSSTVVQQAIGLATVPVVTSGLSRRHSRSVYFSLFEPSNKLVWSGNVKRYQLDLARANIVDERGQSVFTSGPAGEQLFRASAQSAWSRTADGANVLVGGAATSVPIVREKMGEELREKVRNVLTHVGQLQRQGDAWIPINDDAAKAVPLTDSKPVLSVMGFEQPKSVDAQKKFQSALMVATQGHDASAFGSFLGASPLVVQYDATVNGDSDADDSIERGGVLDAQVGSKTRKKGTTIFVSSNKGFLHAFDDQTGKELFAFMPPSLLTKLLPKLPSLEKDSPSKRSQPLTYGLDSPWIAWRQNQGKPQVMLYGGMGRGGRNIYGLDVTHSVATAPNPNPKLRFVIRGGQAGPYARLGQTWSKPVLTQMQFSDAGEAKPRAVIIFGGGYDAAVFDGLRDTADSLPQALPESTLGNAIYIVDAVTGQLLWWASRREGTVSHPDVKHSIPMSVKVLDTNGDGLTDRLYFADIVGQVFRVQFGKQSSRGGSQIEKIAMLGRQKNAGGAEQAADLATGRYFFKAPSVAVVRSDSGGARVALALGSGNFTQPLVQQTRDRLFVFYDDLKVASLSQPLGFQTFLRADDLPEIPWSNSAGFGLQSSEAVQRGWQMALNGGAGEKVLASPLILNNQLFFASFTPRRPGVCGQSALPHQARLYGVSLKDAAASGFFKASAFAARISDQNHQVFPINGFLPPIQFLQQGSRTALLFGARVLPFGHKGDVQNTAKNHANNTLKNTTKNSFENMTAITTTRWRRSLNVRTQ